jgi:hypothetical protein
MLCSMIVSFDDKDTDYDLYWATAKSKKTIDGIKPLQGKKAAWRNNGLGQI